MVELKGRAFEGGVNYFDTAEGYGNGNAERVLGKCLKKTKWPRKDFVLSTKLFASGSKPNDGYLSRKHIIEGATASLSRLDLDYADIIFAHRYDPFTPIEEVCRTFNWLIDKGKAFYWATSEWTAEQVMEAFNCCDRLGLVRPIADQIEYNVFAREKFEVNFAPLYEKYGYGTTVWSPLGGGYLTGKYNDKAFPKGARYTEKPWPKIVMDKTDAHYIVDGDEDLFYKRLKGLTQVAEEFKVSQAQFYLAWCLANKDVSTAIVGTSKPEQMEDNLKAIDIVKKWTPEMEKRVNEVMGNVPKPPFNWRDWKPEPDRRSTRIDYAK
eukprot:TRINITY_DN1320_c0_g1_i7.p1 TRINITY_DN1320_c0_g1~~TRINITY_DN1320_c0_g1_i7.p1  ORF type:complete len:323 (-),score=57.46 TRINITY_DN1320_c0_g1_i7:209-1177(-)